MAYVVSLIVFASAVWGPAPILAQVFPGGGPNGGGGGISFPVLDTVFKVCDDGDATKCLMLQASGISTSTTRTFTLPNVSDTVAVLGTTQTFTATINISSAGLLTLSAAEGGLQYATSQTPDSNVIFTGPTGNSWTLMERADNSFDFNNASCGGAACTNPQLNIPSAAQNTTQYNSQAYWGNAGRAIKTLTESAATSAFRVPITAGTGTGGVVDFTVFAADASDQQTLTGVLQFSGVNKAATETCATPTLTGTALNSVSTGTLTCTYAADTTPANACDIQFNCTSSLTQTTLEVYYRVNLVGPGQVSPQ